MLFLKHFNNQMIKLKETLKNKNFSFRIIFIFYFLISSTNLPASSQTQTTLTTGSSNRLSVSLSNTMGVQTFADANANVEINNEAKLVIDPKTTVADSFGCSDCNGITGDFTVSPNGASFDIDGLVAENNYVFGEGTEFISTMKSVENPDKNLPIRGTASSKLVHDMTLTVDQTNSSFTQAFSSEL